MVRANARVANGLAELLQMGLEVLVGEGGAVVTQVGLRDDPILGAQLFVPFQGLQGLVGVEVGLELHVGVPAGVVHHDAATLVLVIGLLLSVGVEESSERVAVEVVEGGFLAREQAVPLQGPRFPFNRPLDASRGGPAPLFGVLAGGAQWSVGQVGGSRL